VIKVSWSCKKRKWKLQFDDGFVDLTASFKLSRVETISICIAWFSCTIFPKKNFGKRKGLQCSTSCSYSRGGGLVYDDPEVKLFPFIAALLSLFIDRLCHMPTLGFLCAPLLVISILQLTNVLVPSTT